MSKICINDDRCRTMFASKNLTKSTLISGPSEFTKSFIFEAALHWAEEGRRVVYIAQAPLESLPSTYHDRNNLSSGAFKLMRFMYLPTYESLVEQLVDLHTYAVLPSVVLIDDLDAYISDPVANEQPLDFHVARLCAFIRDSTNACSRILKAPVQLCVAVSTHSIVDASYAFYFDNFWNLRVIDDQGENGRSLEIYRRTDTAIRDDDCRRVFNYRNLDDRTLVLKQIYEKFISRA